jgi:sugar O-acyltransferase (sialic acid O-acetyltransferase NeuD family)
MTPRANGEIIIVGSGETAEIAYEYFTHDSAVTVVAFAVEREFIEAETLAGLPIVPLEELSARYTPRAHAAFVAVSSTKLNRVRTQLFHIVKAQGFECVSYISSKAFVWHNVKIGENVFIFENNVLQHNVRVGDNVVLWSGNHIGHRSVIRDHCFVSSHVVISGFCDIGTSSFLGVNSTFADGITIGHDAVVGAGAVVTRDLAPRGVYIGNPARATGGDSFRTFDVADE